MIPVHSFAPDLVRGNLGSTWIYIIGPIIGVIFEFILKGKATDAGGIAAQDTTS